MAGGTPTLDRVDLSASGDALLVTITASDGSVGEAATLDSPGVADAVRRLADAWAGLSLFGSEYRWQRWGQAGLSDPAVRLGYGALDVACSVAAARSRGVPLSVLIGGAAGSEAPSPRTDALPDDGMGTLDADAAGDIAELADAALAGHATTLTVTLARCGGLAGLRRIAALARALNMSVVLRAATSTPLERGQCAEIAEAFGLAFHDDPGPGKRAATRSSSASRIRQVRLRRIVLPLVHPYASAMYLTDKVRRTIIEIETDDGLIGLGETGGSDEILRLAQTLAKGLIGADPADRRGFVRRFAPVPYANANGRSGWQALGGLELALWDIVARRLDLPLADLLGRADPAPSVRAVCLLPAAALDRMLTRQELAAHFSDIGNAARVVERARAAHARYGFNCFKYKSVGGNAAWDIAVMRGLRETLGPDAQLRFDPNAAYDTATAARLCRSLEPLALEYYEDPTDGIEGLARLRHGAPRPVRPIATNMVLIHFDQIAPTVRRGAIDVLLADIFQWGGVETYRDMAAAAEAFRLRPAIHSFYESGVATAANVHLALGLGLTGFANDQGHQDLGDDVLVPDALHIEAGRMALPQGAGLGVSLDEARMRALTADDIVVTA